MQKIGFAEALDSIVQADRRYHRDAYVFLRDALGLHYQAAEKIKGRRGPACGRPGVARGRAALCAEGIWSDGANCFFLLGNRTL